MLTRKNMRICSERNFQLHDITTLSICSIVECKYTKGAQLFSFFTMWRTRASPLCRTRAGHAQAFECEQCAGVKYTKTSHTSYCHHTLSTHTHRYHRASHHNTIRPRVTRASARILAHAHLTYTFFPPSVCLRSAADESDVRGGVSHSLR